MRTFVVFSIIVLTMYGPGIPLVFGLPTLHLEDLIVILAVVALLFSGRTSMGKLFFPRHLRRLTIPHISIILYVLLVTLVISPTLPQVAALQFAGIFATLSMLKPFFVVVVLVGMGLSARSLRRIGTLLIFLMFVQLAVMYCQKNNLFGINQWFTPLYAIGELDPMFLAGTRVVGTFDNPNVLGTALAVLGTLAFSRTVFGPGKFIRIISGTGCALALVFLVWFAKTRQGTACLVAGCFMVFLLSLSGKGHRGWAMLVGVGSVIGIIVGIAAIETTTDISVAARFAVFTGGQSITEETSLLARIPHWFRLIGDLGAFILTGKGRTHVVMFRVTESGYVGMLMMGGIPALTLYLVMLAGPVISARRRLRYNGMAHPDTWLHAACWATIVPLLLADISNATFTNSKAMTTVILVYGLSYAAMRAQDEEEMTVFAGQDEFAGAEGLAIPGYAGFGS